MVLDPKIALDHLHYMMYQDLALWSLLRLDMFIFRLFLLGVGNYQNETKIEQGCDKRTYPKLMLNRLKIIENPTFIYIPWGSNSKKLPWKLCPHVRPMIKLRVN